MQYLNYIKNPKQLVRASLLKYARRINNQKLLLKVLYKEHIGQSLNLENPTTFTEKMQWLKLNDHNPIYHMMIDKYEVKKWVSKLIGEQYIIPTIGIYDSFDDIDFNSLPNQFVLKDTTGGGGSGVIICKDKTSLDIKYIKSKIESSMQYDIYKSLGEWAYKGVKSRIIVEEYMSNYGHPLSDYKFFCFNGTPQFFYVATDRFNNNGEWPIFDFYDMNCKLLPFTNKGFRTTGSPKIHIDKFDEMTKIASALAQNIPFLRVDLYLIGNKVFFGETTFYHESGLYTFTPGKYDSIIGEMLELPSLQ